MDLSPRTQYAIRALVCLSVRQGPGVVTARQIADFAGIPGAYVEQVMHDLGRAGIVRGRRGKGGGYVLIREPESLTMLDVIEALEGPIDQLGEMRGSDPLQLSLDPLWDTVRRSLRAALGSATVADVAARASATSDYSI